MMRFFAFVANKFAARKNRQPSLTVLRRNVGIGRQLFLAANLFALFLLCWGVTGCTKGVAPVFDVPSLLGQDIESATKMLGKPTREETIDNQIRRVWVKDGVELWVNWKPDSGRVTRWSFRAKPDDAALSEPKRAELLKAISAPENDARYSVEWIETPNKALFFTGATIVPTPKTHTVTLRVGGVGALVEVLAQPQPPDVQASPFITLTPWQSTFSVPDDTKLVLGVQLQKRVEQNGQPFKMQLQIEVDGKMVRDVTTHGPPTSVQFEI